MIMMMMMMMTMMTNTIPYRRTKTHIWDKVLMGFLVHPLFISKIMIMKGSITGGKRWCWGRWCVSPPLSLSCLLQLGIVAAFLIWNVSKMGQENSYYTSKGAAICMTFFMGFCVPTQWLIFSYWHKKLINTTYGHHLKSNSSQALTSQWLIFQ